MQASAFPFALACSITSAYLGIENEKEREKFDSSTIVYCNTLNPHCCGLRQINEFSCKQRYLLSEKILLWKSMAHSGLGLMGY